MLNSIQLTNFQRHRNLKIDFTGGINALRGSNEAGKSTLLRAVCYALFGLKAMPVSLADLVTWGEPENSMKVELTLAVDGATYTIKRGKSGAEVNYDGGIVTGQSECTTFLSKLLKADAGAAARLVLANQGEIRGAIESGTKETTELMERLAEFDQIDRLIELMQEKLVLKRQRARTGMQGKEVFYNPSTGAAYVDEQSQRRAWRLALRSAGVRYRAPKECRDTSVTLALMLEANPMWVAQQHGHSMQVMLDSYAKWIPSGDGGSNVARINNGLGGKSKRSAASI